jgi:hypothetical protein
MTVTLGEGCRVEKLKIGGMERSDETRKNAEGRKKRSPGGFVLDPRFLLRTR